MNLYTYYRSSASYRVRIALHLKRLPYEPVFKHLRRGGGEHREPQYLTLNPQGLVPALEHQGVVIAQSLAIIEYLEEIAPDPALLPRDAIERASVRSMALAIACDIHPLNNLRVLQFLKSDLHQVESSTLQWCRYWIAQGFKGLEEQVRRAGKDTGYMWGSGVTMADVCLVPQMYSARRFGCDLDPYPRLSAIAAHLESLEPFKAAAPEMQLDTEP